MGHLVPEFPDTQPCISLPRGCLDDAVFGLAEEVETTLQKQVDGEGQPGHAVGENAVADVAAGGVVAGQRGRLLPGFAAAACVLVVVVRKGLIGRNPESLDEKEGEERCRYPLREV